MKFINEIVQWLAIAFLVILALLPLTIGIWESGLYRLDLLGSEVSSLQTKLDQAVTTKGGALEVAEIHQSLQEVNRELNEARADLSVIKYALLVAFVLFAILISASVYLWKRLKKLEARGEKASLFSIDGRAA